MRRRLFLAAIVCLLVALAIVANYGPISHYLDARSRLEKASSGVAALEERNAALQADLSKLLQPGYLEELAREELTYSLPDEDVFIVTGDATGTTDEAVSSGAGVGGVVSATEEPAGAATVTTVAGSAEGSAGAGLEEASPGFLERLLSRIAALF